MKNTEVFNDYDMVVSISERTINNQLDFLVRLGTLRNEFAVTQDVADDGNYVYQVLDSGDDIPREADGTTPTLACIDGTYTPRIDISSSGTNVTLLLAFDGGDAWFWKGMGRAAKLAHYDMTGWRYGISITLDLAAVEKQDINQKIAVPDLVADQLHHFIDSMFTVNHLFMDFESTDLLRFDPAHSDAGAAGDSGLQQLVEFMQFYLKDLVQSGNPWILGYAVSAPDAAQYEKGVDVPDQLRPVGTTFSVFADAANPDLSSVNFVLATKGGHGAVSGTPLTFDTNWMTPQEQCDGKLIYSHGVLVEPFILQPVYNQWSDTVYKQIQGHVNVPQGNSYGDGKKPTDNGFAFTISNVAAGDDQYVNTYTAAFSSGDGSGNGGVSAGEADVAFGGELTLFKQVNKDMGCTAQAWARATIDWSGKVALTTVKDVSGNGIVQLSSTPFTVQTPQTGTGKNPCAEAWEDIGDVLHGILDVFTLGLIELGGTDWISDVFDTKIPGLGDLSNIFTNLGSALGNTLLMPAGGVFFFKNPSIDPEGNIAIELTYKAQT
jgi:hypothetical protein